MIDILSMRTLLADEYGIRSEKELETALKRMERIDVGLFASPTVKEGATNEYHRRKRASGENAGLLST